MWLRGAYMPYFLIEFDDFQKFYKYSVKKKQEPYPDVHLPDSDKRWDQLGSKAMTKFICWKYGGL